MNWNSTYYVYEIIAILAITICLGMAVFQKENHYDEDIKQLYFVLEAAKNKASLNKNHPLVKKFAKQVRQEDLGHQFLPRFQQARLEAQSVIGKLEKHKKYLNQYAYDATQPVAQYLIRERNGYTIQQVFNQYIDHLNDHYKDLSLYKFHKIPLNNKDHVLYSKRWGFVEKDFVHYTFEGATVAEALTMITQKQMILLRYAQEVLKRLSFGPTYSCGPFGFSIGVSSLQDVVQVGDTLTMEMFVGLPIGHWYYAEINGKQVRFQEGKYVQVAFEATGQGKQYWTGKINYCEDGIEQTKTFKVPYWVK